MTSLTATMHKNNAPKPGWAKTPPLVASSWFLSFEFRVSSFKFLFAGLFYFRTKSTERLETETLN
jgi:hypothetical protein